MFRTHFNHPILSIYPGLNPHEILIAGGGGSSKTGVPNLLQICTVDSDGTLKINKTIKYTQQASCITSHFAKRKTYAVVGVGSNILLLNKRYSEINSFDTHMEKLLFRSLCISPRGNLLVAVDGDDILRLFQLPSMKQVYYTSDRTVQRATFVSSFKSEEGDDDNLLILCASDSKVQLLKPEDKFPLVAESDVLKLEPKQISSFDDAIYFTGISREKKCSLVVKLKYDKELGKLETVKTAKPANALITEMSVNSRSVVVGTSEGDVIFLDRFSLNKQMVSSKVHSFPITTICSIDDFTITGGIDSVVSVIKNKKPGYKKYIFIVVCILAILIGVLLNYQK